MSEEKCFCHLNGYAVKDATARSEIAAEATTRAAAINNLQASIDEVKEANNLVFFEYSEDMEYTDELKELLWKKPESIAFNYNGLTLRYRVKNVEVGLGTYAYSAMYYNSSSGTVKASEIVIVNTGGVYSHLAEEHEIALSASDVNISEQLTALNTAINNEQTARTNADSALDSRVTALENSTSSGDSTSTESTTSSNAVIYATADEVAASAELQERMYENPHSIIIKGDWNVAYMLGEKTVGTSSTGVYCPVLLKYRGHDLKYSSYYSTVTLLIHEHDFYLKSDKTLVEHVECERVHYKLTSTVVE